MSINETRRQTELVVEQAGVEIIFADALKRQASEPVVAADFGIGIGEVAGDAEAGQSTGQEIGEGLTADFDTLERDRKSVVEGKRGSVRVALGGRRSIQKKQD